MVKAGEKKSFLKMNDCTTLDILNTYCDNDRGILDWTPPGSDVDPVEDAVAYVYGGKDSVDHFNADISDADYILGLIYGIYYSTPPTNWSAYSTNCYRPYQLLKANWELWTNAGYPLNHKYNPNRWAGIDCSGFVQRGAKYHKVLINHSPSMVLSDTRVLWGAANNNNMINTTMWASDEYTTEVTNINLLVPGDILVKSGAHVVVVWKIDSSQRTRGEWQREDIKVIEAEGDEYGRVVHINDHSDYPPSRNYKIRRIKE